MKTLYDGTEVPNDTPTKNVSGQRYLLTPEEITERQAEEEAFLAKKQKYEAEEKYKDLRRAELAPLDGEGMDAIRKAITALAANSPVPAEFTAYTAKVEAIKAKYQKPKGD
jgi:hypothetical protein